MPLTLHDATIPHYLQVLPTVLANLDKAEAWARDNGMSEAECLGQRLAPDMFPLSYQFRYAAMHSASAIKALQDGQFTVVTDPAPEDFASLRAMLTAALDDLKAIDADAINSLEEREVGFVYGGEVRMRFSGSNWLQSFALPNFYFHVSMAYAILRNLGVGVGKADFLGAIRINVPA